MRLNTRRWELLRTGMQDWLVLKAAAEAGHSDLVQQALEEVLANRDDPDILRTCREKLIEAAAGTTD